MILNQTIIIPIVDKFISSHHLSGSYSVDAVIVHEPNLKRDLEEEIAFRSLLRRKGSNPDKENATASSDL